jgi:hypothetical protein
LTTSITTQEQAEIVAQLRTLFLYTEHSGNTSKIYSFSLAGGKSTYSFGLIQFDVGARPDARAFLKSINFTDDEIAKLSGQKAFASGDLQSFSSRLCH